MPSQYIKHEKVTVIQTKKKVVVSFVCVNTVLLKRNSYKKVKSYFSFACMVYIIYLHVFILYIYILTDYLSRKSKCKYITNTKA